MFVNYEIVEKYLENFINCDSKTKDYFKENLKNIKFNDYVKFLELEIFKYNKLFNYKVKKIELIYDYFNNPYIYVNFNPCGYMIVSLINNESVIIDPFGFEYNKNDGLWHKNNLENVELFKLFSRKNSNLSINDNWLFKEYKKKKYNINDNLLNLSLVNQKSAISKNEVFDIATRNKKPAYSYSPYDELIKADVEVPYSWWFKCSTFDENFGYADVSSIQSKYSELLKNMSKDDPNYKEYKNIYDTTNNVKDPENQGLCHYVALGMLLLYNEYFRTANVFSEKQIKKYFTYDVTSIEHYDSIAKVYLQHKLPFSPFLNEKFVADLWVKHGWGAIVTTSSYLQSVAYDFVEDDKALSIHRRSAGWIKPWKWIKDGFPCLIYGSFIPKINGEGKIGHAIVVYGMYDNGNKLLCHYGWYGRSQVIVSSSLSGQLFLIGMKPGKNAKPVKSHFKANFDSDLCKGDKFKHEKNE